jgi:hypothetical protein
VIQRPGEAFQSFVLANFQSLVSPFPLLLAPASTPCSVWICPPFSSALFSAGFVQHLLNFFFCAPPELLVVSELDPSCFARLSPAPWSRATLLLLVPRRWAPLSSAYTSPRQTRVLLLPLP